MDHGFVALMVTNDIHCGTAAKEMKSAEVVHVGGRRLLC